MRKLSSILIFFWGVLAICLLGCDLLSYSELMGSDWFHLFNRDMRVWFAHIIIFPPLILSLYYVMKINHKE